MKVIQTWTTFWIVTIVLLSIFSQCASKKIRVHTRVLMSVCDQREKFSQTGELQSPVKSAPKDQPAVACGWFKFPKCHSNSNCRTKFKTCDEAKMGHHKGDKIKPSSCPVKKACPPCPTCKTCRVKSSKTNHPKDCWCPKCPSCPEGQELYCEPYPCETCDVKTEEAGPREVREARIGKKQCEKCPNLCMSCRTGHFPACKPR